MVSIHSQFSKQIRISSISVTMSPSAFLKRATSTASQSAFTTTLTRRANHRNPAPQTSLPPTHQIVVQPTHQQVLQIRQHVLHICQSAQPIRYMKANGASGSSTPAPPEYYVHGYNNLVYVNQPGRTSTTTLIRIVRDDKMHEQGMSRHFATYGIPTQRFVFFATNMFTNSRVLDWVTNFKNFEMVVKAIHQRFCVRPEYTAIDDEMRVAEELRQYEWWILIPTHLDHDDLHLICCCIWVGRRMIRDSKIGGMLSLINDITHLLSKNEPIRKDSC
jgi:hypothetical protein